MLKNSKLKSIISNILCLKKKRSLKENDSEESSEDLGNMNADKDCSNQSDPYFPNKSKCSTKNKRHFLWKSDKAKSSVNNNVVICPKEKYGKAIIFNKFCKSLSQFGSNGRDSEKTSSKIESSADTYRETSSETEQENSVHGSLLSSDVQISFPETSTPVDSSIKAERDCEFERLNNSYLLPELILSSNLSLDNASYRVQKACSNSENCTESPSSSTQACSDRKFKVCSLVHSDIYCVSPMCHNHEHLTVQQADDSSSLNDKSNEQNSPSFSTENFPRCENITKVTDSPRKNVFHIETRNNFSVARSPLRVTDNRTSLLEQSKSQFVKPLDQLDEEISSNPGYHACSNLPSPPLPPRSSHVTSPPLPLKKPSAENAPPLPLRKPSAEIAIPSTSKVRQDPIGGTGNDCVGRSWAEELRDIAKFGWYWGSITK